MKVEIRHISIAVEKDKKKVDIIVDLKYAGRIRSLYCEADLEEFPNPLGKTLSCTNCKDTKLGSLGTENSFFPKDKNPEFFPEEFSPLDLFGVGLKIKVNDKIYNIPDEKIEMLTGG